MTMNIAPDFAIISEIAAEKLRIETLVPRNSDSLDFHEVSVWELRAALEAAFLAGQTSHALTATVNKNASPLN